VDVAAVVWTRRDRILLASLVFGRALLGFLRLGAVPHRFWNFEEAYNASVAWAVSHAPIADQLLALQYRSFCGGCSVVAALGAPLLATGDRFWVWKLLPLLWTAATQAIGFYALDRLAGRAAAWIYAALFALPMLGALDLSLMAWGNHQETALFAVCALALLARERGAWTGLVLGVAVWFDRTAAYEALVLVPAALWRLPGQRVRMLLGFALGCSLLLLPVAVGDAGWYRMDDPLGGSLESVAKRAATLFAPTPLAARLWFPLSGMALGAWILLFALAVAARWAWTVPRVRPVLGLGIAYATAYCATQFPIFIVAARLPINNIRYHAPWAFVLTLGVAAGLGIAWDAGRRRTVLGLCMLLLATNAVAFTRVTWSQDPQLWTLPATDQPRFVNTAVARLPASVLARTAANPAAEAMLARMQGMAAGRAVLAEGASLPDVLRALGVRPGAVEGLGETLIDPCDDLLSVSERLLRAPEPHRLSLGRGMAVAMSFCPTTRGDTAARFQALRAAAPDCALCSAAGAIASRSCEGAGNEEAVGACLAGYAALGEGLDRARDLDELYFGAGRSWTDATKPDHDAARVAAVLGPHGAAFLRGAADPAAGAREPAFARERAAPGVAPRRSGRGVGNGAGRAP